MWKSLLTFDNTLSCLLDTCFIHLANLFGNKKIFSEMCFFKLPLPDEQDLWSKINREEEELKRYEYTLCRNTYHLKSADLYTMHAPHFKRYEKCINNETYTINSLILKCIEITSLSSKCTRRERCMVSKTPFNCIILHVPMINAGLLKLSY